MSKTASTSRLVNQPTNFKTIVGILFWIAVACGLAWTFASDRSKKAEAEPAAFPMATQLAEYFGRQPRNVELWSPEYQMLAFGDPIFLEGQENTIRIGNISYIDFGEGYEGFKKGETKTANAVLYGNAPKLSPGDYLLLHETGQSMGWVIKTMLPPDMRARIGELILTAWQKNEQELVSFIEKSIADAGNILREDFQAAVERHRNEFDQLANRFQKDLLEKEILPLVKNEIWPIVREETQPLAETIGREIWQEVSVLRFGLKYIYDRSPLPEKNLTEQEFKRFIENKATPILESHLDDFVQVQKQTLRRISKNQAVKQTVSNSVRKVIDDPEVQKLFNVLMQEVLIKNERLRESIRDNWESPEARQAIAWANSRLDPTIIEIGRELFGSTDSQITPEFARVLRNKVLHKDERWLTLHTKSLSNRDEEMAGYILAGSDSTPTTMKLESSLRLPVLLAPADGDISLAVLPGEAIDDEEDEAEEDSSEDKDD